MFTLYSFYYYSELYKIKGGVAKVVVYATDISIVLHCSLPLSELNDLSFSQCYNIGKMLISKICF